MPRALVALSGQSGNHCKALQVSDVEYDCACQSLPPPPSSKAYEELVANPYISLPNSSFWKKHVVEGDSIGELIPAKTFKIRPTDQIMTAGSCFAQNLGIYFRDSPKVSFVQAEALTDSDPVFSARYGNIYTTRQLLGLFLESITDSCDRNCAVQREEDNQYVDIHRPFIHPRGFGVESEVAQARKSHISFTKQAFEKCDVFIFTLGLTECWIDNRTSRALPACPGIYSAIPSSTYSFQLLDLEDVIKDMELFILGFTQLRPNVKIITTVSPVPLTATYTNRDVLSATLLSKSILRTACAILERDFECVYYFPSYEAVFNPFMPTLGYKDNLRSVRQSTIDNVMRQFEKIYFSDQDSSGLDLLRDAESDVICDDVEIENSLGF